MITQGKWKAVKSRDTGLWHIHGGVSGGEYVCCLPNNGKCEANANLIARAPRLEEENRELVEVLKEVYAGLMRAGKDSWTVRQIREVLSKVKGD